MRILLINKFWKPVGGVEEHCGQLLRLFEERGHEVIRFGMQDNQNDPVLPEAHSVAGVSFHAPSVRGRLRAAGRSTLGFATRRKIATLIAAEKIDVAHVAHAYHQLGMTFLPVLRRAGIPTLLDLHDYKVGCPRYLLFNDRDGQICTVCLDRRGAWAWAPVTQACWNGSRVSGTVLSAEAAVGKLARAYSGADLIVVRNRLQADAAVKAGVSQSRIRVIPNWVVEHQAVGGDRVKGRHMLFVGRLVREKGVDVLIKASARSGVPVVIVGDGPMREELEQLAAERGAAARFVGWLGHDEVLTQLERAAALVVPSIWPEVFPLVVCEAFGVGTPVIGTAVGGVSDLLGGGRGYLCAPQDVEQLANTMERVVDQPEDAGAKVSAARAYSRDELSYAAWRAHYFLAYEDLGLSL